MAFTYAGFVIGMVVAALWASQSTQSLSDAGGNET